MTGNPEIGTAPEIQGKKSSWVRKKFDFRSPIRRLTKSKKSDAYRRCREKGRTNPRHCCGSPFSAVRFDEQESREMGEIRENLGNEGREFSAVKTFWRRASLKAKMSFSSETSHISACLGGRNRVSDWNGDVSTNEQPHSLLRSHETRMRRDTNFHCTFSNRPK